MPKSFLYVVLHHSPIYQWGMRVMVVAANSDTQAYDLAERMVDLNPARHGEELTAFPASLFDQHTGYELVLKGTAAAVDSAPAGT